MKIYLLTLLAFFSLKTNAQNECGTISPSVDYLGLTNPNYRLTTYPNVQIRVFIHIVNNTNGNANDIISESDAIQSYFTIYNQFYNYGICIGFSGYDYINNDSYYNMSNTTSQFDNLIQENVQSNAVDIYIVNSFGTLNGRASGIPGKAVVLSKDAVFNGTTLAHELGHALGLYHTFNDEFCIENADASNCATCGDLICDTPADPVLVNANLFVDANCNHIMYPAYQPLTNNLMSYYQACRNQFTVQQGQRMLATINQTPILTQCLLPINGEISNETIPLLYSSNSCLNATPPPYSCYKYKETRAVKGKLSTSGNVTINPMPSASQLITKVSYVAEEEIALLPGFEVNEGAKFSAVINNTCPLFNVNNRTLGNNNFNYIDEMFEINQQNTLTKEDYRNESSLKETPILQLYPNPTTGALNISAPHPISTLIITTIMGQVVTQVHNINNTTTTVNTQQLAKGTYLLKTIFNNNSTSVTKFTKE